MDYEKAFDSVETNAVIQALKNQGINTIYIKTIQEIYTNATAILKLHKESEPIFIRRGVRQGDTMSPKLFVATLEEIFKRLNWDNKGINVNGKKLNHLRFADDIVIISRDTAELEEMLSDLNNESRKVGLKMNMSKTKVMFNMYADNKEMKIGSETLEEVSKYTYLGQEIWPDGNQVQEIKRKTQAGWAAFSRYKDILTDKTMPNCLKRKLFNQCILPAITYGSETWTLNKDMERKLKTTQRSMERMMLGYTRRDRKRNIWIREQTRVKDVLTTVKGIKWRWAGHLGRMTDGRWSQLTTEWQPLYGVRKRGRPRARWRDELVSYLGTTAWMRIAGDRRNWQNLGEAFAQQWDDMG